MTPPTPTKRTYWHLEKHRRVPDAYELGTSELLYHRTLGGFEVATPVGAWHARHALADAADWETFRDPRATTYASYVELQRAQEIYVDGVLDAADRTPPPAAALDLHARAIAPLRYPLHALHMVAAYLGSLAPGGRLAVALAFTAADDIRRVQRLAYRLHQLRDARADLGADARATWERDPAWQPLREVIEHLLVAYDFAEGLAALCGAVAPALDGWIVGLAPRLRAAGDEPTAALLAALDTDAGWHRRWYAAARALSPDVFAAHEPRWTERAARAIEALPR